MDKIITKRQKIIENIIYSSMIFSLVYLFGIAMDLELNILLQGFMVIFISGLIKFFLLNPIFLYILLVILFLISILINYYFPNTMTLVLDRVYYLFKNIVDYLTGIRDLASNNILPFWSFLIVLVSLYTAFVIFKNKRLFLLLPVYMGAFLYYWYVYFDEAYWMMALFFFLFLILIGLDKYYKTHTNFKETYTPWIKTIILYSLLIVTISLILPKNPNYIQWTWLQNKAYDIFPGMEDLRSANTFSRGYGKASNFQFSMTGYQEDTSRLGGPVRLRDKTVMTVKGDGPFYLRGNVRHTYTGHSWETEETTWEEYWLGEDFSHIPKNDRETYYKELKVNITNHSFSSTTLFSPYRPISVNFKGDYQIKLSPDYEIALPQGVYSGENYTVKILKPHRPEELIKLGVDNRKGNINNLNLYLQLPEDKITEDTRKLVKKIVKNSNTDLEKALAIEEHLRKNYKYNIDVKKVPKNREFVDYFLFETKEGYCTYYATSMAVMLRLEGIPSRYVEGYLAQELIGKNTYIVRQKNAHAWVEAFIEPIGWITFEPTPAYPIVGRARNESYDNEVAIGTSQNTDSSQIKEDLVEDMNMPVINSNEQLKNGNIETTVDKTSQDTLPKLPKRMPIILVATILLLITVRFLIRFIQIKHRESKIKKLPNKEKVIYLYNEITKLNKLLGYSQNPGETHYEYAHRISYRFYTFGKKGIKDITEIFVRNKYSLDPTPEEDVLKMERYKEVLEKRLKNYLGWKNYYYGKYFKLR